MNLLLLLPAVVLLLGAVGAGVALGRLVDEAQQLRVELERVAQLRPQLVEVGSGAQRIRLALARLAAADRR